MTSIRKATHSGSSGSGWYSNSGKELSTQLSGWLSRVDIDDSPARAIIVPHAGYRFCGSCAAYAYKQVNPENIERVFILGPSHHVHLSGCTISQCDMYETPLYNLQLDNQVIAELERTGKFDRMNLHMDEDEHSIEMQLPYIAKVMESRINNFTIIPVLVGSTSNKQELEYGKIFSPYLHDSRNLFVISSDFCHWGKRFHYTHYNEDDGEIWQSIETLDKKGMNIIEQLDVSGLYRYLANYSNTICGRHPIGIFLHAVGNISSEEYECSFKFHKYAQSSSCKSFEHSSVSYAAGTLRMTKK